MSPEDDLDAPLTVTLGGAAYTLGVTYGALREIEQAVGSSAMLAIRLSARDCTIEQVAVILCAGMRAGGLTGATVDATAKRIWEDYRAWSPDILDLAYEYLKRLGWRPDDRKKVEAEAAAAEKIEAALTDRSFWSASESPADTSGGSPPNSGDQPRASSGRRSSTSRKSTKKPSGKRKPRAGAEA